LCCKSLISYDLKNEKKLGTSVTLVMTFVSFPFLIFFFFFSRPGLTSSFFHAITVDSIFSTKDLLLLKINFLSKTG
jgi:hypothetical protein